MTYSSSEPPPRRHGRTPNLTSADPYAVLGLVRGASLSEIRRAYFALVREYPPEEQPEAFKTIRAAYARATAERMRFFSYGDAMLIE